jgi:hypothetical protein
MKIKPALQMILKGIVYTEEEKYNCKNMRKNKSEKICI